MSLESSPPSVPTFAAAILHRVVGGLIWAFAGALLVFVILGATVAAGYSVSDQEGILFEIVGAMIGIPFGAILFARPAVRHGAIRGSKRAAIWFCGGSVLCLVGVGSLMVTRGQLDPEMSNGRLLLLMAFVLALVLVLGALFGAWLGSLIGSWRSDLDVRP